MRIAPTQQQQQQQQQLKLQYSVAPHPSHRKPEHRQRKNEEKNCDFRGGKPYRPRDTTEGLVGADVFEELCPQQNCVDADEVLFEVDFEGDVLQLG